MTLKGVDFLLFEAVYTVFEAYAREKFCLTARKDFFIHFAVQIKLGLIICDKKVTRDGLGGFGCRKNSKVSSFI